MEFILSFGGYVVIDSLCKMAARTGMPKLCDLVERLPCPPTTDPRCRGKCASGKPKEEGCP